MYLEWRYDVVFEYQIVTGLKDHARAQGYSLLDCLNGRVEITYFVITSLHQGSFKEEEDRNIKRNGKKKTRKRKIVDFAAAQSQIDKSIEKFYKLVSKAQSKVKKFILMKSCGQNHVGRTCVVSTLNLVQSTSSFHR